MESSGLDKIENEMKMMQEKQFDFVKCRHYYNRHIHIQTPLFHVLQEYNTYNKCSKPNVKITLQTEKKYIIDFGTVF